MGRKPVRKGVVLAAGDGGRFGQLTSRTPKVLLRVLGKPLIRYSIEALVRAGITEIAIVVGHLGDRVVTFLHHNRIPGVRVEHIPNPDYRYGNAISVEAAGCWAGDEPFVLCMGDHIMHRDYIFRFLDAMPSRETLAVDFRPGNHHVLEEATKVRIDGNRCVRNIGKELTRWDGIDCGIFLQTADFVSAIRELRLARGPGIGISDVVRFMVDCGHRFDTCETTGLFWADIDTAEDMLLVQGAERWL